MRILCYLDDNPVEDVSNVRKVRAMVLNGRFLDRAKLDAALPKFE